MKVVHLRSQDTIDTERLCNVKYDWLSLQEARDEALEGWTKLLGVTAKVLSIKGNHFEPFSQEIVSTLLNYSRSTFSVRRGSVESAFPDMIY